MHSSSHKKAIVMGTIITIIVVLIGFFIITSIIVKFMTSADIASKEAVCKASVAAAAKTKINAIVTEVKAVPFLCETIEMEIPSNNGADKLQIMEEIADEMTSCWSMFGEGRITDAVDQKFEFFQNECFVCYTMNMIKTDDFSETDGINAQDFAIYLATTPHIVKEEHDNCRKFGGFCVPDVMISNDEEGWKLDTQNNVCQKKGEDLNCRYNPISQCFNKGGTCMSDSYDSIEYARYDKWKCDEGRICYIKKDNFYSYADYIERYAGAGRVVVSLDKETITSGESYAIMYGDRTKGALDGVHDELGAAIATVGAGGLLIPGVNVIIAGALITGGAAIALSNIAAVFKEREVATIYFTPLSSASEHCSIVSEIGEINNGINEGGSGGGGANRDF